jgi:hypothetical protein
MFREKKNSRVAGADTPNNDKQFSLTAVGGVFDEVNLLSADGFKEIKHRDLGAAGGSRIHGA